MLSVACSCASSGERMAFNHIDDNIIDGVCLAEIQVFYDPRHSRGGSRLASNDEGDARPDEVCSRVESAEDRRVRIVALTPCGKELIAGAFRKHSGQMQRVFSELSPEELRGLETALKKVGKRAAVLMEES
jgi:hypothetical protein